MKTYIYPENLKANVKLWFWNVRDFIIKDEQIFNVIKRIGKAVAEHGFMAHRMTKSEIKRMLALYFGTSMTGDGIPDIEGENYFDMEDMTDENI